MFSRQLKSNDENDGASDSPPETGLAPRLAAAFGFALAACVPVGFLFLTIGRWLAATESENIWFYSGLPVSSAALCGFLFGAKIFDSRKIETAFQAAKHGVKIGLVSYVLFVLALAAPMTVSMTPFSPLGLLYVIGFFFLYGGIFVGWLIIAAGAFAGLILHRFFAAEKINAPFIVSKKTARVQSIAAIFIFIAASAPAAMNLTAVNAERKAEADREIRKSRLIWAASDGDAARLESLLADGGDADTKDNAGWTLIIWAARNRHAAAVEVLLKHGANPNVAEDGNMTPLTWAANDGELPLVKTLTAHGADVNLANKDRNTPLMFAAMQGHPETAAFLLENGARVEAKNDAGETALSLAVAQRDTVSKRDLEQSARDKNGMPDFKNPALLEKARRQHAAVAEILIRYGANERF